MPSLLSNLRLCVQRNFEPAAHRKEEAIFNGLDSGNLGIVAERGHHHQGKSGSRQLGRNEAIFKLD